MDEDEWETIFRVYDGDNWDSHDDYLSQERTARYGDGDDSQFRSWKLDQWNYMKIKKVGIYQVFFLNFQLIFWGLLDQCRHQTLSRHRYSSTKFGARVKIRIFSNII